MNIKFTNTKNIIPMPLVLMLLLFVCTLSNATNYYVSGNGNDSNNGLTPTKAFRTLQKAADVTAPGDIVYIMNGIYDQTHNRISGHRSILYITTSGTDNKYITYTNYPGHTPKIVGANCVWSTVVIKASYIKFEGIEIEGNPNLTYAEAKEIYDYYQANKPNVDWVRVGSINYGGINVNRNDKTQPVTHHVEIRNCKIHDCPGGGIGTFYSDYLTIENNVVYNNAWYGTYAGSGISVFHSRDIDSNTGYKTFVRGNTTYNNKALIPWADKNGGIMSDGNGIIIDDNKNVQVTGVPAYVGKTLVENNLSYNNGGSGIHSFSSANVDIINNTGYNNGTVVGYAEIYAGNSANCNVINNIMYARNGGYCNDNYGNSNVVYDYNLYFGPTKKTGTNDKSGDPLFIKLNKDSTNTPVANFRLQPTSPAVNTGTSSFSVSSTDKDGYARIQGVAIDKGAFERSIATPVTGSAISIPGLIEAENFDNGGQGIAYNDQEAANLGGAFRNSEGVDILAGSGNYKVGHINPGEWLSYTINVAAKGSYNAAIKLSNGSLETGLFRIEANGFDVSGIVTVAPTNTPNVTCTKNKKIELDAGEQILRIYFIAGGFDIASVEITPYQDNFFVDDCVTTSTELGGTNFFTTFPNPAKDVLTIRAPNGFNRNSSISLLNRDGKNLFTQVMEAEEHTLNVRQLPAGLYFIKIDDKGRQFTQKIIKE